MKRRLIRIVSDDNGASIVEMGLAAPLLATFLIGMVDLSGAYSTKLQLEQAAQRTIEYVQRNGFAAGQETTLQTEAQTAAGTGSAATVTTWSECNGTTGAITDPCATPPVSRYIRVSITKTYTPYFKIRWGGNSNGTYTVRGQAGLRIQ